MPIHKLQNQTFASLDALMVGRNRTKKRVHYNTYAWRKDADTILVGYGEYDPWKAVPVTQALPNGDKMVYNKWIRGAFLGVREPAIVAFHRNGDIILGYHYAEQVYAERLRILPYNFYTMRSLVDGRVQWHIGHVNQHGTVPATLGLNLGHPWDVLRADAAKKRLAADLAKEERRIINRKAGIEQAKITRAFKDDQYKEAREAKKQAELEEEQEDLLWEQREREHEERLAQALAERRSQMAALTGGFQ